MSPPKLPSNLAKLPRMGFTSRSAPNSADQSRSDLAFDVKSASSLVNEFEKREGRIRGLK